MSRVPIAAVERGIVFGGMGVPLERASLNVLDPYEVMAPDLEFLAVPLISFKASGDHGWLERGLSMKSRTWKKLATRLQFLREILAMIAEKKKSKPGESRKKNAPIGSWP